MVRTAMLILRLSLVGRGAIRQSGQAGDKPKAKILDRFEKKYVEIRIISGVIIVWTRELKKDKLA